MTDEGNVIILVTDLMKSYKKNNRLENEPIRNQAISHLSFTVHRGEIYAILGANGAGKSTTIRILSTLMQPDSGEVMICGIPNLKCSGKIRKKIGVVFQDSILDRTLTVNENLSIRGQLYGIVGEDLDKRICCVSQKVGCEKLLKRVYGTLSGGEKRRTDIARALLHEPEILLLDEPTNGLDPGIRKEIWDMLCSLRMRHNLTIVFSTHYMEEVMRADNILILRNGNAVASGSPSKLLTQYTADLLYMHVTQPFKVSQLLKNAGYRVRIEKLKLVVNIKDSKEAINVLELCQESLLDFEVKKSTMEDVFMEVLGAE